MSIKNKNSEHNGLCLDYEAKRIGSSWLLYADCLDWFCRIPENSLHAIVTDPPYGVKEYDLEQLEKRKNGNGGIWRLPPQFDGHTRSPLPRFTALSKKERTRLQHFFVEWAHSAVRALRPGAHIFIATNSFMSQLLYSSLIKGGLEFRGEIIRIVRTLRGGDRPKNAESEFPNVSSMPRGGYEPWGLFRKPMLPKMKVSDCLREFETGGLRRRLDGNPFCDVIFSERTPRRERTIANHPSLKPQSFLREIVYAALPLGEGIIVDPFMGSGATIAAAEACNLRSIGIEKNHEYYNMACNSVTRLSKLANPEFNTYSNQI